MYDKIFQKYIYICTILPYFFIYRIILLPDGEKNYLFIFSLKSILLTHMCAKLEKSHYDKY